MKYTCQNCGIEGLTDKNTKKFCSPNCRVTFGRKKSIVTDGVTLDDPVVTAMFRFTIKQHPESKKGDKDWDINKEKVREESYWYNVPLAAVPIMQKGWPAQPDYMNGRDYFLWWKNNFKTDERGPLVWNPLKKGHI